MTGHSPDSPETVANWARHAPDCPLYMGFCRVIAADPELMRALNRVENTPRLNVLFGGVQLLLMRGLGPGLASYYPSLVADPRPPEGSGPIFREFVLAHEDELARIGSERLTQTNEVRRCTALLPGIWETGSKRFHLVDLGASAGLNLALDHYRYRWGGITWGPDSPVTLEAEPRGRSPQPQPIEILGRVGIDLNPLDPASREDRLWLEALVWPSHHGRRERLRAALEAASEVDIEMVKGDVVEVLGEVLATLPGTEPALVINSFVLNQLTAVQVSRLDEILAEAGGHRDVRRVSLEFTLERKWPFLSVGHGERLREIGQAQAHGEWLELYARP